MAIGPVQQHVLPVAVLEAPGSSIPDAPSPLPSADRVETSEADHLRSSIARAVTMISSSRTARLQSLAEAVRSGAFQPMPEAVADQILAQAELEARLVAYFH